MFDNRISINPDKAKRGRDVEIRYNGLLVNSGADSVYLHYGFDGFNNPRTVSMERKYDGFYREIPVQGNKEINFCFKDSANNWDNNNGWNWLCSIF